MIEKFDSLAEIARLPLAKLPTPLERLDNLTRALGGPQVLVKPDELAGTLALIRGGSDAAGGDGD